MQVVANKSTWTVKWMFASMITAVQTLLKKMDEQRVLRTDISCCDL